MIKILLDTDIIINLLKKDKLFISKFLTLESKNAQFYYNPIIIAEVYAGAFKSEEKVISHFFERIHHIDICKYTGIQAGQYANKYKKSYHKISLEDYLIAACAQINSLSLWTNNKKHYPMDDLILID